MKAGYIIGILLLVACTPTTNIDDEEIYIRAHREGFETCIHYIDIIQESMENNHTPVIDEHAQWYIGCGGSSDCYDGYDTADARGYYVMD